MNRTILNFSTILVLYLIVSEVNAQQLCDRKSSDASCVGVGSGYIQQNTYHRSGSVSNAKAIISNTTTVVEKNRCISLIYEASVELNQEKNWVVRAGSGYFGAGSTASPNEFCDPTKSTCSLWVPKSHPYLFNEGFTLCNSSGPSNSKRCSIDYNSAWVSINPNEKSENLKGKIIACENTSTNIQFGSSVLENWKPCPKCKTIRKN